MAEWEHQAQNIAEFGIAPNHALYWDPRTGKTRTCVGHARRLHDEKDVRKTLVVAPQLPLRTSWLTELQAAPEFDVHDLSFGRIVDRVECLKKITLNSKAPNPRHHIVLVNYDVLGHLREQLLKWRPQLVVADEAHLCKSPSAVRTRALQRVGQFAQYRRALTGTPDPRSYVDYYSIYRFLDPTIFGTRLQDFRDRYVISHPIYKTSVIGYREEHLPELRDKVFSIASRKRRRDCFDMPHELRLTRAVTLDAKALSVYQGIVKEHEFASDWLEIDATQKIARFGILQRLTSGFAYSYDENGDRVTTWIHTAKIQAAVDEVADIVEAGEKVVIFYLYRAEGDALLEAMSKAYGAKYVAKLDGDTPTARRMEMTAPYDPSRAASSKSKTRVLIVQEQVGALGISLALANYAVFVSYSMNYAAHSQASDRIWSAGGNTTLTTTYLTVPKSIDVFIRALVAHKDAASRLLLDVGFSQAAKGELPGA